MWSNGKEKKSGSEKENILMLSQVNNSQQVTLPDDFCQDHSILNGTLMECIIDNDCVIYKKYDYKKQNINRLFKAKHDIEEICASLVPEKLKTIQKRLKEIESVIGNLDD